MDVDTVITGSMSLDVYPNVKEKDFDPVEIVKGLVGTWSNQNENFDIFPDDSLEKEESYGSSEFFMPEGERGKLHYKAHRIGERRSLNNVLVSFWGNLVNYPSEALRDEIIPFFADIVTRLEHCNVFMRGMGIEVRREDEQYLITRDQRNFAIIILETNTILGRAPLHEQSEPEEVEVKPALSLVEDPEE